MTTTVGLILLGFFAFAAVGANNSEHSVNCKHAVNHELPVCNR